MTTLQQSEDYFELINDSAVTRTMEGRISFWNHSAEKLYGWRKEEAIGRVSHDLLQTQFPKPLEEIESELLRNGRWEGELVHTTQDGRPRSRRKSVDFRSHGPVAERSLKSTSAPLVYEIGPEARADTYSVEIGTRRPMSTQQIGRSPTIF